MKDFWKEIWDYLGECKPNISCDFIVCMWEAGQFFEGNKNVPHLDLDIPIWAQSKIAPRIDMYSFLCDISKRIANKTQKKLPENLHARIVLGVQNEHTKEYINNWID